MTDPDAKALAANLMHRFVSNGVPLEDYHTTVARLDGWPQWCATWEETADARIGDAAAAESAGATLTAAELRLVASIEYHFGKFLFVHDQSAMRSVHAKAVQAYRQASPDLEWPARFLDVRHRGAQLPGVLRTPADGERPWPTVMVVPGLDAAKEEMHGFCEVFLRRGMATFTFDGPGQGEAEYEYRLPEDWEEVAASAVETLAHQADVDGGRLAVVGVSLGGYFAARAAARAPGLLAGASVGGCYSMGESWPNLSFLSRQAFRVRSGVDSEAEAAERAASFSLDGVRPTRDVPFLVVHGARDRLFDLDQARRTAEHFGHRAELVVEPEGNHVLHNLAYRVRPHVADWLRRQMTAR